MYIWDHVESYMIHMFLACRQKITFTSNLKLIISFLDHKYHLVLELQILVASIWQAILTTLVSLRLAWRPSTQDEFWDWTRWFIGTGEVDFGSLWDKLWDIMMCFFGTGEVDIWVITRWIMGPIDVTFLDRRSWYWDITRWIMGQIWDNRRWY